MESLDLRFKGRKIGDMTRAAFHSTRPCVHPHLRGWLGVLAFLGLGALAHATAADRDLQSTPGVSLAATRTDSYVSGPDNRVTGLREGFEPSSRGDTTAPLAFDSATMMRAADLRPGMKGYGLTVFSGIRPERFDAEVIGVRHRAFPDDDMILCRLTSPYLQDIGVIAGMSGSPVYMNDKLIGAVAYGWSFNKEALAGVTTIESMMRVFDATSASLPEPGEGRAAGFDAFEVYARLRANLDRPPSFRPAAGAAPVRFAVKDLPDIDRTRYGLPESFDLEPLATPLFITASSPRTLDLARSVLAGLNVEPMLMPAAGSASSAPSADAENSPGGKLPDLRAFAKEFSGGYGLAIPMIEGDMSMAGVGTVTYRKEDRLVAFGHPMFGYGIVSYPMAPARINALIRSAMRPVKLGESLGQVGTVRQDRLPAIGGVFGPAARMFPVSVTIDDPRYQGRRHFNYRVWDDREMGPMLGSMTIEESMFSVGRGGGDSAALFRYMLQFDDGTSFTKEDFVSDPYGSYRASFGVAADLGMMVNNPYRSVHPTSVTFSVRYADRLQQARIESATLDKSFYRPGDTVTLTWDVLPYRQPLQRMKHSFRLPDNLAEAEFEVLVGDAGARQHSESRRSPGNDRIRDYASLLKVLRRSFPANKVYVTVQDSDTGVAVRGQELPKLPGSVIGAIQSSSEPEYFDPVCGNLIADAEFATAFEISGRQTLKLRVSRRNP